MFVSKRCILHFCLICNSKSRNTNDFFHLLMTFESTQSTLIKLKELICIKSFIFDAFVIIYFHSSLKNIHNLETKKKILRVDTIDTLSKL